MYCLQAIENDKARENSTSNKFNMFNLIPEIGQYYVKKYNVPVSILMQRFIYKTELYEHLKNPAKKFSKDISFNDMISILVHLAYFDSLASDEDYLLDDIMLSSMFPGSTFLQFILEYDAYSPYPDHIIQFIREEKPDLIDSAYQALTLTNRKSVIQPLLSELILFIDLLFFGSILYFLLLKEVSFKASVSIVGYILALSNLYFTMTFTLLYFVSNLIIPFIYYLSMTLVLLILELFVIYIIPKEVHIRKLKFIPMANVILFAIVTVGHYTSFKLMPYILRSLR
jgi:hypothetical protein